MPSERPSAVCRQTKSEGDFDLDEVGFALLNLTFGHTTSVSAWQSDQNRPRWRQDGQNVVSILWPCSAKSNGVY